MAGAGQVALRPERYDTLFLGELPYDPLPDDAYIGISGLCRLTHRGGPRPIELQEHIAGLPEIIDDILVSQQIASMDESPEAESVFAFVDDESREAVGSIVTGIFTQWELTHSRKGLDPLLPHAEHPSKWLVVETAAAVVSTVGLTEGNFDLTNTNDRAALVRILSTWGPEFTKQWFSGQIIQQWAVRRGLNETEQTGWQETFTPGIRKHFLIKNPRDPLNALDRFKEHLEVTLTDEHIVEETGWSIDEVQSAFPPSMRKHIARQNITDPLKAVRAIKGIVEDDLTDEKIAQRLGKSQDYARETYRRYIRIRIAVGRPNQALAAIEDVDRRLESLDDANIAESTGLGEEAVRRIFTPSIRLRLVLNHKDALGACQAWIQGNVTLAEEDERMRRKLRNPR